MLICAPADDKNHYIHIEKYFPKEFLLTKQMS